MKKVGIIALVLLVVTSTIVLVFGQNIYNYLMSNVNVNKHENEYLFGSKDGEHGKISLKIRLDNSGAIKEIYVLEHPDNDIASAALQKLIKNSLDKQNTKEIDSISGATETSDVYKSILNNLLDETDTTSEDVNNNKVSLKDPEIITNIERVVVNPEGFKSGLGGYVMNQFQSADYNKNGNLVTHEYICAVMLNPYNRIEDVRFDHIASNISFDKNGKIPTGGAKAYTFTSDKAKPGFNGLTNDGNYIDIFDFEDKVLTYRHFEDIKNRYINKKGYAPFVNALENAIDNARYIGASNGDTLGLSCYKVLKKKDIKNATEEENGRVSFKSDYCMLTVDKEQRISSCMFDNVENDVQITNKGNIFGAKEKEIYTLNELANTEKYSKIENSKYAFKIQLNLLGDYLRGNTIDDVLSVISKVTDDKGMAKNGTAFEGLKNIDFIEFIDLISRAFVDAVKIKAT